MKYFLIHIIFLLPFALQAQQLLTLENAIDTALKNNFDILIAKNNNEIDKINNTYGVAGGLPSVYFNAGDNNSLYNLNQKLSNGTEISKDNVVSTSINTGVTASMVLFNGFRVQATKEKLSLIQQQSEIQLNQQIQNTIASVMLIYYDILRQQSYLAIMQTSIDVSENKAEIIKGKYDAGMANEADILQAETDLNMAIQDFNSLKISIEQEKINLLQLMGVSDYYSITIQDSIIIDSNIKKDSVFNYLENNPDFLSATSQIKINEQIVKELKSQRYPSIKVNTGYNFIYSSSSAGFNLFTQNYGPIVGATLQIPIYNGGIYKTQQDIAMYEVENAELQRSNLLSNLKSDALKTYISYQNTLEQIKSQQIIFENTGKLVAIVVQKFEANQSTILDLKAAQLSYENAGYMLVNLQYSAKVAEIELKRMVYQLSY